MASTAHECLVRTAAASDLLSALRLLHHAPGLKRNLNSVLIFDQKSDLAAKKFAEGKVVWTVKAPQEPGTYSVSAVFHFGTEKASSVGTVSTPTGAVLPRGGPGGASSRVMFAKPVTVIVR